MTFAAPYYLWLLLAIPPAMMVFFWWSWRARRKLATQFIQARLLPGLIAGVSPVRRRIRAACLILAVAGLIVALARPQWGYDLQEVRQRGLDIMVAIDTSKSMLAEDIAPNRLERAKLAALDLMQQAKSDRLGLVAFAGTAFLECPLTVDDSAFRQSVEALDVNTLPEGGTAIAAAIETAQKAFKEGDNYKVLVLFTDGEDHDSGALDAAKQAAEAGLRIFTIGIGSPDGDILRFKGPNGQTEYIRDENGDVVKSRLNEELLREIAGAAKGFYLPLRGANTVDTLYQKGLAPLPKTESQEQWIRRPRERYHWPLAFAIVLLAFEMFLPERKRAPAPAFAKSSTGPALAKVALLALLLLPLRGFASASSALREYKSGNFDKAYQDYEQLLEKDASDPRLHFNAGAAAYRNQQFGDAARHFDQALTSPDLNLQEQAYYNLGNTRFHLGEKSSNPTQRMQNWEQSLTNFQNSLQLNPQDADAKYNYAYVKKRLEELKKQQQQQQNQQNQQSKNNQQKNSQSQQPKNQPQQSKNNQQENSQSKQQQARNQKEQEQNQKKQQEASQAQEQKSEQRKQEQAKASPEQQKNDKNAGKQSKREQAYATGEMTPEQARQLLDSQKSDEHLLPAKPSGQAPPQHAPVKDW